MARAARSGDKFNCFAYVLQCKSLCLRHEDFCFEGAVLRSPRIGSRG